MFGEKGLYGVYDIKVNADGTTTLPKEFCIDEKDALWFLKQENSIVLLSVDVLDKIVEAKKAELEACTDKEEKRRKLRQYYSYLADILKQFETNRYLKVKVNEIFEKVFGTTEDIIAVGSHDKVLFFTKSEFKKRKSE